MHSGLEQIRYRSDRVAQHSMHRHGPIYTRRHRQARRGRRSSGPFRGNPSAPTLSL
ncbi:UNVERIFIED_ORG: hypothetical protein MaF1725_ph0092 [Mycobacterium phage ADLER F1725]